MLQRIRGQLRALINRAKLKAIPSCGITCDFSMLQCRPSKETFVGRAAICQPECRSADFLPSATAGWVFKCYHYDSNYQRHTHRGDPWQATTLPEVLSPSTASLPYKSICKIRKLASESFIIEPIHQMPW